MLIINIHHYSTITSMLITCSAHNQIHKIYLVIFLSVDLFRGILLWLKFYFLRQYRHCSHIEVGELLIELMSEFFFNQLHNKKNIKLHLIKSIRGCKMYDDLLKLKNWSKILHTSLEDHHWKRKTATLRWTIDQQILIF